MLLANGVRAGGGPYRFSGGAGALALERARAASPALALGFNIGEATVVGGESISNIHGIPSGTPRGWVLPVKGGALKSWRRTDVAVDGTAAGELGYPASGMATISIDAGATGGLIVGATGTATISIDGTAAIVATLNSTGTATISIDGSAALGAIASLTGTATLSIDGHAEIMALGYMTGTTIETGELTPAGIAAEVWKALAAQNNIAGSMGELLNSAGAAADPLLSTVEGGLTMRAALRILLAGMAGTSERTGNSITFTSPVDGSTVRITGSFDAENNRTGVILDGD